MEHIEEAGVHSGDSACVLPPSTLSAATVATISEYTERLADALDVRGLLNVQYAVKDGQVLVIEANPRASRTVPFVSKATGVPLAKVAARVMLGATLAELRDEGLLRPPAEGGHVSVKEAVLPFNRFPTVDTLLGPGDALDRRGHGHRPLVRARVREEPGRGRRAAARDRHDVPLARGPRQGAGPRAPRPASPSSGSRSSRPPGPRRRARSGGSR